MATNAKCKSRGKKIEAAIAKRQVGSRIWEERGEEGRRGRDVLRRGGRSLKAAAPRSFYFQIRVFSTRVPLPPGCYSKPMLILAPCPWCERLLFPGGRTRLPISENRHGCVGLSIPSRSKAAWTAWPHFDVKDGDRRSPRADGPRSTQGHGGFALRVEPCQALPAWCDGHARRPLCYHV